jgi:hypothetical protein
MIIPDDLKLLNSTMASPAIIQREQLTLYPVGDSTVTSGSGSIQSGRIRFEMPVISRKSYDCSTMFIHFNFKINIAGATKSGAALHSRIHVHDSIESIFKTITVDLSSGAQRLEFINDYNALESALNNYCSAEYLTSFGGPCFKAGLHSNVRNKIYHNYTNNANLTAANSERTNQMSVPLRLSGISSTDFVLPSSLFGSSGFLTITIDLEAPNACIVAAEASAITNTGGVITGGNLAALGGTAISYTLSNIRMTVDALTYSAEYEDMLANALASSRLVYPIKTFDLQVRSIPTNVTKFTENLNFSYSSVNSIFIWFVRTSEQNSHLWAGKDRIVFPTGLSDVQLRVNGINIPASRPLDVTNGATEAYCSTLKALGLLHTAEQFGGLYSDDNVVHHQSVTGAWDGAIVHSFRAKDSFYGSNRPASYGLSGGQTQTGVENPGNNLGSGFTLTAANDGLPHCPYSREMSPSRFLIGFNLKKLLKSAPAEISGENLLSTSGQISYELNFSPATTEGYQMYFAVYVDKFIELNSQMVRVNQ